MAKSMSLDSLLHGVFKLGVDTVSASALSADDQAALEAFHKFYSRHLAAVSPTLASMLDNEWANILGMAQIAKARMDEKSIVFPCREGDYICVSMLVPQLLKYVATPDATHPAYTDYPANSWTLTLKAGQKVYLLGSDTAYYKPNPDPNLGREVIYIFKDGIVEFTTTPKLKQFRVVSDRESKIGAWFLDFVRIPVEKGKALYLYRTPRALPLFYDVGYKLYALPDTTGISEVHLFGVVFYEAKLASDVKWIS